VEISADKVAVLTDMAVKESEIDEAAAEDAVRRAEGAMKDHKLGDEEYATVKASLQKSLALVRVKRRRSG
jgi:F-type H+-transporting ATPase subunit epsilon